MQYRTLGNTNLNVSLICLGTMTWGEQNSEAEAHEQLDHAVAAGINFIDAAEIYPVPPKEETQGRTEAYLGSWLKQRKDRDQLVLASKVCGPGEWVGYMRDGQPRLDRKNIEQALDASLRRLNTDYIDLYQLHWPERKTNFFGKLGYTPTDADDGVPIAETLGALGELVQKGKIRHIGVSNETPWGVMEYLRLAERENLPRLVSIQNPYNLLNRTFEVGLAEIAHREQTGLLAYSPLGFGVLSGKYINDQKPAGARLTLFERFQRYTNPQAIAATAAYVALAEKHGLSPAQMALAYVNSRPFLTSTIIGATTMDQLRQNIDSVNITLDAGLLEEIEAIHTRQPNPAP
ncbi:aryl-alcohol dehydrogenase-like predicted oxidoreductase [Methylohalomonas lacus]|uniref:Protein tas n=1 Tax=Methylohalomonas lacus TaxID=398773 RepID=A0AAE3HI34_9GAMM|nr:NADP(H)-dependent aldo-keto reductase [Methylohalomonas lacus]MCS3902270.1 aryl-alcohol dehydrogenase-like predicted oxidoreductase [Methylohalomonas lacus]